MLVECWLFNWDDFLEAIFIDEVSEVFCPGVLLLVDVNVEITGHNGWGGSVLLTELMYPVHHLLELIQLIAAFTWHVYIYDYNVVAEDEYCEYSMAAFF